MSLCVACETNEGVWPVDREDKYCPSCHGEQSEPPRPPTKCANENCDNSLGGSGFDLDGFDGLVCDVCWRKIENIKTIKTRKRRYPNGEPRLPNDHDDVRDAEQRSRIVDGRRSGFGGRF